MSDTSQTVGRISIEWGEHAESSEPYRDVGVQPLTIRRAAGSSPARRPLPVIGVILFVNVALTVLAGVVRSMPAIGAAVVALGGLVWLATQVGRDTGGGVPVELELDESLRGQDLELPVVALRDVGIGKGGGQTHTVFVRTDTGRQLLLDALSHDEATAAASALQDAIARRQPA